MRSPGGKLVLRLAGLVLVVLVALVAVGFFQATRWSPVVSGVDPNGTKWTAYVEYNADIVQTGMFLHIAAPGQEGTTHSFVQAGPMSTSCRTGEYQQSDQDVLDGRIDFGLVPPDAVAVVAGDGKRIAVHPLPAIPFLMPDAKLYVYDRPAPSAAEPATYPVDRNGKKLPSCW